MAVLLLAWFLENISLIRAILNFSFFNVTLAVAWNLSMSETDFLFEKSGLYCTLYYFDANI